MANLSPEIFELGMGKLMRNFKPITQDAQDDVYAAFINTDDDTFMRACINLVEGRHDKKYFPLIGELKKAVRETSQYKTAQGQDTGCGVCYEGQIFRDCIYPELSPVLVYTVLFFCTCSYGQKRRSILLQKIADGEVPEPIRRRVVFADGLEDYVKEVEAQADLPLDQPDQPDKDPF